MFVKKEQFDIELSDLSGARFLATLDCEARYWDEGGFSHRVCRITMRYGNEKIEASDRDYFETFCRVRERLELVGLIPMCYGASRNVFPSAMGRDMADGLRAYRMRIGERSVSKDLVSIFDSGADIDPVSVSCQKEFFDKWLESLKI